MIEKKIKVTTEEDGTRIESRSNGDAKVYLPDGTCVYWSETSIMISCSDDRQIILFRNGERWITRPDSTQLVTYHDEEPTLPTGTVVNPAPSIS